MLETIRSFFAPPFSTDSEKSTTQLIWLVRLRWLALSAQLLSIIPAIEFQVLELRLLPAFVSVILALSAFNAITWFVLQRGWRAREVHLLGQLCADMAALSALLVLTGGAWNPLVPILFVHSVLGAMLLQGRSSLAFFGVLILALALIQASSTIPPAFAGPMLPPRILFPAQFLIALVFWILTAWLSNTLSGLQRHVAQARERQTRIDRLRAVGALAAGLSHEFATPLNTAQLKLARLARTHGLEKDADLVTAREELERCGEVLHHMAGSQLQPERLALETVDVDQLARQICTTVGKLHEGVPIRFSTEGRGPRRALLPSVAFSQGLINLVDNAIESAGGDSPVDVLVKNVGDQVDLTVSDRGEGWPKVVRTHLGEPFVTTKPNGVGLGLYYVHCLAEAVGARLILEDREGGGAIARLSLPRAGDVVVGPVHREANI
jgi:two-component system sensor histidine kinase RegB